MKIKRKKSAVAKTTCPCGTDLPYSECCEPFHKGAVPETPEALMRSRYSAYAKGLIDYIIDTTDPLGKAWDSDMTAWVDRIRKFAAKTTFDGVKILSSSSDGNAGVVRFHAKIRAKSGDLSFTETSQFVRREGRWLYSEGLIE
jgi:SEC-C motif-containing protein